MNDEEDDEDDVDAADDAAEEADDETTGDVRTTIKSAQSAVILLDLMELATVCD